MLSSPRSRPEEAPAPKTTTTPTRNNNNNNDDEDEAGTPTDASTPPGIAVASISLASALASTPRLHARRDQPCQRLSGVEGGRGGGGVDPDSVSWRMNMKAIAREDDDDDDESLPSSKSLLVSYLHLHPPHILPHILPHINLPLSSHHLHPTSFPQSTLFPLHFLLPVSR